MTNRDRGAPLAVTLLAVLTLALLAACDAVTGSSASDAELSAAEARIAALETELADLRAEIDLTDLRDRVQRIDVRSTEAANGAALANENAIAAVEAAAVLDARLETLSGSFANVSMQTGEAIEGLRDAAAYVLDLYTLLPPDEVVTTDQVPPENLEQIRDWIGR